MPVLILGPSKWRAGASLAAAEWLVEYLPGGSEARIGGPVSPLEDCRAVRSFLAERGVRAHIMEDEPDKAGEALAAKFQRIVRACRISQYFVYWPAGANRAGLDVEFGFLLRLLEESGGFATGEADVRLFIEGRSAEITSKGLEGRERGARTRYYGDFVTYRCPVVPWNTLKELFEAMASHAEE